METLLAILTLGWWGRWCAQQRKLLKRGKQHKGYIYFYRGVREHPFHVKIGRAKEPISRLRAQRTANPYGLDVLGVVAVTNDIVSEGYLHKRFADKRINREWFHLSPFIWVYIFAVRDVKLTRKVRLAVADPKHR